MARSGQIAMPSVSVIVTTYEWPEALDVVLDALADQSDHAFDVVVVDDGSGSTTADVVERWRHVFDDRLTHVWQPDQGYRLARARNLGVLSARGDYLVFVDGDCVPRRHFVRAMRSNVADGWFVAGRRVWLSSSLSERLLARDPAPRRWSALHWLLSRESVAGVKALTPRDRRVVGNLRVPEFEPHERAYGPGFGIARADFERANGYDMRFAGWGEEDVDLATRVRRLGLRCGHAGPAATLLHLWHPSRMVQDRPNWDLLQETEASARTEATVGLRELVVELAGTRGARG